ncbi:MAG TPA: type II toxin-antitoxin system CcdA family antitoxin [Candidatus Bathyarchaeia archaeon]
MTQYETVSAKIPAELKAKIKRHGINASKIVRQALEREVARAEAEELDMKLEHLAPALDRIRTEDVVAGIREDRERR